MLDLYDTFKSQRDHRSTQPIQNKTNIGQFSLNMVWKKTGLKPPVRTIQVPSNCCLENVLGKKKLRYTHLLRNFSLDSKKIRSFHCSMIFPPFWVACPLDRDYSILTRNFVDFFASPVGHHPPCQLLLQVGHADLELLGCQRMGSPCDPKMEWKKHLNGSIGGQTTNKNTRD